MIVEKGDSLVVSKDVLLGSPPLHRYGRRIGGSSSTTARRNPYPSGGEGWYTFEVGTSVPVGPLRV